MADRPLRVFQVNTTDAGGGAAQIARALHTRLPANQVQSTFLAGRRSSELSGVVAIPSHAQDQHWLAFWMGLRARLGSASLPSLALSALLKSIGAPLSLIDRLRGHEDFHHPGSRRLLDLAPLPDLVHLHNLQGDYFDLTSLAALSRTVPTIVTLHDAWLLSGHCAHGIDCERWRTGCGECPDLRLYPALLRDGTAFNWRRK